MKQRTSPYAFTLIEMLTVMVVIAILASLIVAVNAFAHKKAALLRADGEIRTMCAACENYKADFGGYPQDETGDPSIDSDTVAVCPILDGDPTSSKYQKGCIVLYKALSGDAKQGTNPEPSATRGDVPDGKPETKGYYDFTPNQLRKTSSGDILYIQDPFGHSYGYSTTAAAAEETYRALLLKNSNSPRRKSGGYNTTFDLWSTGGVVSTASGDDLNATRKRWIKNW